MSSMLSPEGKAYVTEHLLNMQRPQMLVQENGVPALLAGYLERQREALRRRAARHDDRRRACLRLPAEGRRFRRQSPARAHQPARRRFHGLLARLRRARIHARCRRWAASASSASTIGRARSIAFPAASEDVAVRVSRAAEDLSPAGHRDLWLLRRRHAHRHGGRLVPEARPASTRAPSAFCARA